MRPGGGVGTAIHQYVEALPDVEHSLAVSGAASDLERDTSFRTVHALPEHIWQAHAALRTVLGADRFDVLHAHSSHAGALVRMLRTNAEVVYSPHAFATLARRYSSVWWIGQTERVLGLRAATIAAVSGDEARRARRLSPLSRVVRVSNCPEPAGGSSARLGDPLRVVGCGRLTAQKDPGFFASVAELATRASLPYMFTWVGDGAPHYRRLLTDAGVRITGWLSREQVKAALLAGSVLLHGARYEGASFALLNAAAIGLPIVARPVPGIAELPWVRHATTPEEALVELRALARSDAWLHAARVVRAAVEGCTPRLQRIELLRAYRPTASQ